MAKKKEFGEGPIYTFLNYVMWLFASNFYFIACNSLIIIYFTVFGNVISSTYPLLYIVSLSFAPALTALYATMGKLIRDKDIMVTSYYFKSYKSNFKQSFILGFIQSTTVLIAAIDIEFFWTSSIGSFFIPLFIFILIYVAIISLYAFPLLSRFHFKTLDLIKVSFVYSIKKFHVTMFNLGAILCGSLFLYSFPNVTMFFVFSCVCYLIMYYETKTFKEIEDTLNKALESNASESK